MRVRYHRRAAQFRPKTSPSATSSWPLVSLGWVLSWPPLVRPQCLKHVSTTLTANHTDSTITSTLSATIASEFGSLSIISWLGSTYLIALAVVQPLSGKFTDIFGRRAGLLFSCLCFAIGNAICGMAHSKHVIILGRAAAGIGGGGLNSICTFVGNDLIPLRSRGMVQGFGMVTFGAGIGLGGVVGGSVDSAWGWRWAFLILVPFTVLTALGVWLFVPGPADQDNISMLKRIRRIDFLGSILLSAALAILLWSLNAEHSGDGTLSRLNLTTALSISAILFTLFILAEARYASEPVIPLFLLRNRTVAAAALASWFDSMAMYALMFYIPLYFQVKGYNPKQVGIRLLPESLGTAIGSLGSGLIMRTTGGYGILKICVLMMFLAGVAGFSTSDMRTSNWMPEMYLFANGLGFGGTLTVLLLALLSAVERDMQAVTTAVMYAFRAVGATLGVTISGALFREVLATKVLSGLPVNSSSGDVEEVLRLCNLQNPGRERCPPWLMQAYMDALHAVFLLALGFGVGGLVCGMFTRNFKLRTALEGKAGS